MKWFSLKISYFVQGHSLSPLTKQCFVTAGVTLNVAAVGLVFGFTVALLEQLKKTGSAIPINDEEGSWIASLPGLFTFAGSLIVIPIMGQYGRRAANLISIVLLIISWTGIAFAPNIIVLLTARALQGINMGMSTTLGSLLIGEYTSPKNRGPFLMTISVLLSIAVLSAHTIAALMIWWIGALVFTVIALIDLGIVLLSPESPSWLASQGRYEECKRVFRWLRDDKEEEELDKMIEACIILRNKLEMDVKEPILTKVYKNLIYFHATVIKKEFYKPLIVVGHIYAFAEWCGINVVVAYPRDYIQRLCGYELNVLLITTSLDTQRILACILGIYIIKKVKRRVMLFTTVSMNIIALIAIAVYSYTKEHYILPFDHPIIGIVLTHCMVFALSIGTLSMSYIIPGEVLPLKNKTLAGGIGTLIFSLHMFVAFKTLPDCFVKFGVHGYFFIKAGVLCYCLLVVWFLLPETKDRTLQDIEVEFRGKPISQEMDPGYPTQFLSD